MSINLINNGDSGLAARNIINTLVSIANSSSGFPYTGSAAISGSLDVTNEVAADLFMHPQTITADMVIPAGYNGFLLDPVGVSGTITVDPTANLIILPEDPSINTNIFATTGSNIFIGDQIITGSVDITGSLTVNTINVSASTINFIDGNKNILTSLSYSGSNLILSNGSIKLSTGLLTGTASYALTASYVNTTISSSYSTTSSFSNTTISSSYSTTSSYALTASYALNGGGGGNAFPYTGSANISGSSTIIGNLIVKPSGSALSASIDTSLGTLSNISTDPLYKGISVDWYNRRLYHPFNGESLNWYGRELLKSAGETTLNWENSLLLTPGGNYSIDWGNRSLYDNGFPSSVISLNWANRYLYDTTGTAISIDWGTRYLTDGTQTSVDWANRTLNDSTGTAVLNYFGGGSYITFTGTSSYATYAETASFAQVLTLQSYDPLPASLTGTIAVSASTPPKPYFYDGSTWNALY